MSYLSMYQEGIVSREWCEYHSYIHQMIWRFLGHPGDVLDSLIEERERIEWVLA